MLRIEGKKFIERIVYFNLEDWVEVDILCKYRF